jgi:hypothetical protein
MEGGGRRGLSFCFKFLLYQFLFRASLNRKPGVELRNSRNKVFGCDVNPEVRYEDEYRCKYSNRELYSEI